MPLLLKWGEEIDLPCVCVGETVFLILLYFHDKRCIRRYGGDALKLPSDGNFFWLLLV